MAVNEISWTGDNEFNTPIDIGNTGKIRVVATKLASGTIPAVALLVLEWRRHVQVQ
jgi:hypothetical protein